MRTAWRNDGYFFVREMVNPAQVKRVEEEVVATIRRDPPEQHPGQIAYLSGADYFIYPETRPSASAVNAEDHISRVFNCHVSGTTREIAQRSDIVDTVAALLGIEDIDCFQSQFIFKNPGVIGQPWHQDSYYFRFNHQPQIGVWLALSEATLENGCLWVVPGSHRRQVIFNHIPDRRPAANRAYQEIVDQEVSRQAPALMQPGDVLFFHSYLMHQSTDNVANVRRTAMVYHYGRSDTKALTPEIESALRNVNRWLPVRRTSNAPATAQLCTADD
jgi:ectoine hydroxylase-related dioxygenase (phytanoyl-CoA dioxygenase family)